MSTIEKNSIVKDAEPVKVPEKVLEKVPEKKQEVVVEKSVPKEEKKVDMNKNPVPKEKNLIAKNVNKVEPVRVVRKKKEPVDKPIRTENHKRVGKPNRSVENNADQANNSAMTHPASQGKNKKISNNSAVDHPAAYPVANNSSKNRKIAPSNIQINPRKDQSQVAKKTKPYQKSTIRQDNPLSTRSHHAHTQDAPISAKASSLQPMKEAPKKREKRVPPITTYIRPVSVEEKPDFLNNQEANRSNASVFQPPDLPLQEDTYTKKKANSGKVIKNSNEKEPNLNEKTTQKKLPEYGKQPPMSNIAMKVQNLKNNINTVKLQLKANSECERFYPSPESLPPPKNGCDLGSDYDENRVRPPGEI
jgi:hypothetical protein